MANLVIEMPDDLARRLEAIATLEHVTVQQLAIDRLRSVVEASPIEPAGSPPSVLKAMSEPPHLAVSDVEDLIAAIAAAREPAQRRDLFMD